MSFISQRGQEFARRVFRKFYAENYSLINVPRQPERREYGYSPFGQSVMVRHLSFQSAEEVRDEVRRVGPLHVYRSAAYYMYPKAPMEEKSWLGADLVFDIDADHLGLSCIAKHSYRVCPVHGLSQGVDGKCAECGSTLMEIDWVCENCINSARAETVKLVNVLMDDFGVPENELEVGFSGNRGFHVVVYSEDFKPLDSSARREIVNYLVGEGFQPRLHGIPALEPGRRGRKNLRDYPEPELNSWGWRGRVIKRIYALLTTGHAENIAIQGVRPDLIKKIRETWSVEPTWSVGPPSFWAKISSEAIMTESVKIDPVVTTDIHRLMRMSGTLNGKTGLLAASIPVDGLEGAEPLRDAAVLKSNYKVRVRIVYAPAFQLGGDLFDEVPEPREAELPLHAAVYLVLRGLADPIRV
ncbi:MAG: DNA primase small subunit domain-containing protein [Nitrososphaerota archaeon]